MSEVKITYETINIIDGDFEIIDVDPIVLMEMREKLNPPKKLIYSNGDHVEAGIENEKRMREGK